MISNTQRKFDIPLKKALTPAHFSSIVTNLSQKNLLFVGQLTDPTGTHLKSHKQLIDCGLAPKKLKPPAWFLRLKETLCTQHSLELKPCYTISPLHDNEATQPQPPSIATPKPPSKRTTDYSIESRSCALSEAPENSRRTTISDGSMRNGKASFSTLPLQGCKTSCTMRVKGRQNVAKSEILGCYAAALDTPPGSQITNILDNLGVVTTLNRGPPTRARHRLRRTNRTTWNLLFGTISKRNIMMDAIWIKGHTERTSPANKLHNECDELAGLETGKPDLEPSRFPLYDEDFLISTNTKISLNVM